METSTWNKSQKILLGMNRMIAERLKPKTKIVEYCAYKHREGLVINNLKDVPIQGDIFIFEKENDYWANGKAYLSPLLHSPTWLDLCNIANDMILETENLHYRFLDDIEIVEYISNSKVIRCKLVMGS